MEKEEAELLPSGLVTCLLNEKEVRILKISPQKLTIRVDCKILNNPFVKLCFYRFNENTYEEIILEDYEIINEMQNDFYFTYAFSIQNKIYKQNVKYIMQDYLNYIMLKNYGQDNEFSKKMVNYPAQLDYEFYNYYSEQKRKWMKDLNYENWNMNIMDNVELAIKINNNNLYEDYLINDIETFTNNYLSENYVNDHELFQKNVSRIYIGNEFCHNLFPEDSILIKMFNKAKHEELDITLCFTYLRECYIEKTKNVLDLVYNWCIYNNKKIEIIINDWGMLELIADKKNYFNASLGVLLNKYKKDPRYIYKKGYAENEKMISKNSLNSNIFKRFLQKYNIERYEYENCGHKIDIAKGHHSLHIPFYTTNTSQYCPLYAMCENTDRGMQRFVDKCPKYCKDYIFAYPKHLKMVGRYNSLFAFDDTILKYPDMLDYYINRGIDRIVLNYL